MPETRPNNRPQRPPVLESVEIIVAISIMALIWASWYIARERYHFTNRQIAEILSYLAVALGGVLGSAAFMLTQKKRREKEWPHPPMVITRKRDERQCQEAWKKNSVILGPDIHGKPWYWPDSIRVMQGIVLGMNGSGKSTLLKNIITQDLYRPVGPPDNPRRVPMVLFDGKGDVNYFNDILPHVHRAGRLHQLRVLN